MLEQAFFPFFKFPANNSFQMESKHQVTVKQKKNEETFDNVLINSPIKHKLVITRTLNYRSGKSGLLWHRKTNTIK